MDPLSRRDFETLSAYLDGELLPKQRKEIETRLRSETRLKAALEELGKTRKLLREAPRMRAPRSFALTPEMAGRRQTQRGVYTSLRLAWAMASILLVFVVLGDVGSGLLRSGMAAAPAEDREVQAVAEAPEEEMLAGSEAPMAMMAEGTTVLEESLAAPVEPQGTQEAFDVGGGAATDEEAETGEADRQTGPAPEAGTNTEEPMALKAAPAVTPTAGAAISNEGVDGQAGLTAITPEQAARPTGGRVPWVRWVEAGLALAAVASGAAALMLRQRAG